MPELKLYYIASVASIILVTIFLFYIRRITDTALELAEEELENNHNLNISLENKVEVRTQELKNINDKLEKIGNKLMRYLPGQLVNSIINEEKTIERKTERKKLTIFFSDIKGFTEIVDSIEPEEFSQLLNDYLTEMTYIANKWGGTIDKFIGDAIMIFFGAPETLGAQTDAEKCVMMAIEMQKVMLVLRKKWFENGIEKPLEIRIGINTGIATIGDFGDDERLSYTVIGGQVNLASRLESFSNPGGILLSHYTYCLIKDKINCTPRNEKIRVKGINRDLLVYDVVI